ncbi:MAG: hypothetical protein ACR2J1_09545 [Methyloceanibacter sp.]|uniref:hypothetical protein n=1 Tax=Methyloceanibacter sp. TaxID=1965321 RepID=UPI003D9B9483
MRQRGYFQHRFLSRDGAKRVLKRAVPLVVLGLIGAVQAGDGIEPKHDLGQALQQRVWKQALADAPIQTPWPWENVSASAKPEVRRLGLSATLLSQDNVAQHKAAALDEPGDTRAQAAGHDLQLGDVAIGDRVTVTTSKGLSQVYTVTGRALAPSDEPQPDACLPFESVVEGSLRLIIEAIHAGPKTPAPSAEQRL